MGLSTPNVECTDNVCKVIPSSPSSIKAEVVDLENKILKEWKAAGNAEGPSATTVVPAVESAVDVSVAAEELVEPAAVAAVVAPGSDSSPSEQPPTAATAESDEPSDLASKVTELKKMGFAAPDAQSALKRSGYDVSEAAALLEGEEEEKEEILAKVSEIGEEYSGETISIENSFGLY